MHNEYRRLIAPQSIYASGFVGCALDVPTQPDWARIEARTARAIYLADTPRLSLAQQTGRAPGIGRGHRSLPYQHFTAIDRYALTGAQNYGNCTAWSAAECAGIILARHAADPANDSRWIARPATAVIYAARGHRYDGMALATAIRSLATQGCALMRDYADQKIDLTDEDEDEYLGYKWGKTGPPRSLLAAIAGLKLFPAQPIEADADAVKDILYSGGAIHCGSTMTAGSWGDPISQLTTPANHAEALIGYDDSDEIRDRLRLPPNQWVTIWDQSWGDWNRVQNWPTDLWGTRPQGAFVLTGTDALRKIAIEAYAYTAFATP